MQIKKIIILGAGAIGSVVGGLLAKAGHEVTLVGRDPHIKTIAADGLRISGLWGESHITNLRCASKPSDIPDNESYDMTLVTAKTFDTENILETYKSKVANSKYYLCLQNGLGNVEKMAEHFPLDRVVGVRVIFGATLQNPGHVDVTVIAEPNAFGWGSRKPSDEILKDMANTLDSAGVPSVAVDDVYPYFWEKVLYNSALNPLASILSVNYGALLQSDHTRLVMKDIVIELFQLMDRIGVKTRYPTADSYIEALFTKLIPITAGHRASMWFDIDRGRSTEIDAINGYAVRAAVENGLRLPVNETLTAIIHSLEKKGRENG